MHRKFLFLAAAVLAAPSLVAPSRAVPVSLFDRPVAANVVSLPADPDNPKAKPKRTCSYYPGFVVKEVDLGEVGASELSIAPVPDEAQRPPCSAKIARERVINPDDWSGYFAGVKGSFVFFDADDGHNGGMPFAVYTSKTGKKLFEDARDGMFATIKVSGGNLSLRYRRVYDAGCSLVSGKGCWEKIRAATGLTDAVKPNCAPAYDKEKKRSPQFAADIPNVPTVLGYAVETTYADGKLKIVPQKGPVACWLED